MKNNQIGMAGKAASGTNSYEENEMIKEKNVRVIYYISKMH